MFVPEITNNTVGVADTLHNVNDSTNHTMLTLLISNNSVGIDNILHNANNTIVSEGIFSNHTSILVPAAAANSFRETLLLCLATVSFVGNFVAFGNNLNYLKIKRVSSICTINIIGAGCLICFIPWLEQASFEAGFSSTPSRRWMNCGGIKNLKNYFLTFSSYSLVLLLGYCYNRVVKPIFKYPCAKSKVFLCAFGFYILCYFPAHLIAVARHYLDGEDADCAPYFFHATITHEQYAGPYSMALTLLFIYIIPVAVMLFLLSKIAYKIRPKYKSVFDLINAKSKMIRMGFALSAVYIVTNVPFVIQAIITTYIDPNLIDVNVVRIIEILSVSNTCLNPYIYIYIGKYYRICGLYYSYTRFYCSQNRFWDNFACSSTHESNDNEETGINSTPKDATDDSKPIDEACKAESIPMQLKA